MADRQNTHGKAGHTVSQLCWQDKLFRHEIQSMLAGLTDEGRTFSQAGMLGRHTGTGRLAGQTDSSTALLAKVL